MRNSTDRWRLRLLIAATVAISVGAGLGATGSATQTLDALIYPNAKLSVPSATMTAGGAKFSQFQVSVPNSFRTRTTPLGGGNITLQVTSDFSPAGGPSVASGSMQYTCGGSSRGTACSGLEPNIW